LNQDDRRLAVELALIAVIFSMGIASLINADSIKLHLDIFEWSMNKTSLSSEIQQHIQEKRGEINSETLFGLGFISGGLIWLSSMYLKSRKKKSPNS